MNKHPYKTYKSLPEIKCKIKEPSKEEIDKSVDNMLKRISIRNKKYFK